jgi:hypothetical protein
MKTVTVVYTGERKSYNLDSPARIEFPRNVPITVNSLLLKKLPSDDFQEYIPGTIVKPSNIKPIAIVLPRTIRDILPHVRVINKICNFYPFHDVLGIGNTDHSILFKDISQFKIVQSYKPDKMKYYKEYHSRIPRDSPNFKGVDRKIHTDEFCWLRHYDLMYGDDSKKPTLLNIERNPQKILILNLGVTLGSAWVEYGKWLQKQNWEGDEIDYIDRSMSFESIIDRLKSVKYVISTGDHDYNYLCAYMGIPMFCFQRDTESFQNWQLHKFNNVKPNSYIYDVPRPQGDLEKMFGRLKEIIYCVTHDKEIPKSNSKEPVQIPRSQRG